MATHRLDAEKGTLHGHLSRELVPVLEISPGDRVCYRIPDACWGLENFHENGDQRILFEPRDDELDAGHCLSGPVAVRGAERGMVLEVRIVDIVPGNWGWTWVGWPCEFTSRMDLGGGGPKLLRWSIDSEHMTAVADCGCTLPIAPFLGFMAVAPEQPGVFSTIEPYHGGGNLDCREITRGASLFLPIEVDGALFSCGDGHAAQGDGELSGTAIECAIEHAELEFTLHRKMPFSLGEEDNSSIGYERMPRARTAAGWVTFGLDSDLDEAMHIAAEEMFELIRSMHNVDRQTAAGLSSVAVDFRITQSVNTVKGVHAVLPHGRIGKTDRR